MSKYVKILLQAIALLSITLGVFSAQAMAKTNIQYEVINGDTLVISGNGETEEAIKYGKEVKKSQIKKLIIKEGITKITPLGIGKFESVRVKIIAICHRIHSGIRCIVYDDGVNLLQCQLWS